MENKKTVSFLLEIDRDLWESYKATVTRDKTLKQSVVELIKKEVEKR